MRFVDAKIFLRYLTRDDSEKADQVKALLERAERGQEELFTTESVVMELVFVLSSQRLYALDRNRIRNLLTPIIAINGLRIPRRQVVARALELYAQTNIDFVDALAVAHMEVNKLTEIYSYDRHFDHVASVTRIEP